jgi:hypothetical protein
MAIISRQTGLLAAENWKKIYQTFREADFTTYDFETLRKSMIDYIKIYYPEDFNDFTESSEFIALIDLIAFLGQSLAFRTDLNARENFLDTAERRDSVLKLAKLISYNPKRSIPASGYLKIDSVTTTENIYDSDGFNLSNGIVNWNDPANDSWLEQLTTILNSALTSSQIVGRPGNSQTLNGVVTDEYSLNIVSSVIPVFRYDSSVGGKRNSFEVTSATSADNSYVYEAAPDFGKVFNILYRNDNNGNSSNNTGYFFYFKQGELGSFDFSVPESLPNKIVNVDVNNINNTDVWLYSLNSDGTTQNLWTRVPATSGINVIYNDINDRNLYQVNTRSADQISLVFGDGSFSNTPQGNFRLYYRTSNGLSYRITPDEMRGISISFNYISRQNREETITFRASLKYTVANAATRESTEDIKQKAPQQYYTQNRMITGEDYNILPYTSFSEIVKAKAINRTSSGLSRYLDMLDTTGKYSSTNIFGQDGVIYTRTYTKTTNFSFDNVNDVEKIVSTQILGSLATSKEMIHYYYANTPLFNLSNPTLAGSLIVGKRYIIDNPGFTNFTELGASSNNTGVNFVATNIGTSIGVGTGTARAVFASWHLSTAGTNSVTGYFEANDAPLAISTTVGSNAKYLRTGATIKFVPPNGYYFNVSNVLVPGVPTLAGDKTEMYASIVEVIGNGNNNGVGNFINGVGPVTLNTRVPTGALIDKIIPVYKNSFGTGFRDIIVSSIFNYLDFGLAYSSTQQSWRLISAASLSTDNSWYLKFVYNNTTDQYTITYRGLDYIFHSPIETTFYFDESLKIYDSKTATIIYDHIKILKTNSLPDTPGALGRDVTWSVYNRVVDADGFVDSSRIYLTFSDADSDGVPDDPRLFEYLVNPAVSGSTKKIFFKSVTGTDYTKYVDLQLLGSDEIIASYASRATILADVNNYILGQLFYATQEAAFYKVIAGPIVDSEATLTVSTALTGYIAYTGRQDLYYQYRHNSPNTRRVDPSISNIVDLYVLTSSYDTSYREWIYDTSNTVTEPVAPTNTELSVSFSELNNVKAISDTIVFQSAVYKPIFGDKAPGNLQAIFKVVKNANLNISDADIKTSVVNAINNYFDVTNWDFGEIFYFSELAAYLHKTLSPNIASVIIVPKDVSIKFGSLQQINSEPNEIIISAATVDNIEIITAVTASQLNQGIVAVN